MPVVESGQISTVIRDKRRDRRDLIEELEFRNEVELVVRMNRVDKGTGPVVRNPLNCPGAWLTLDFILEILKLACEFLGHDVDGEQPILRVEGLPSWEPPRVSHAKGGNTP